MRLLELPPNYGVCFLRKHAYETQAFRSPQPPQKRAISHNAKKCGAASCAVRYGYAADGELEDCEPDYIADDIDELYKLLI